MDKSKYLKPILELFSSIKETFKKTIKNINIDKIKEFKIGMIHIKALLSVLVIASIISLGLLANKAHQLSLVAYDVILGETSIGSVRNKEEVISVMNTLEADLTRTYDMDISLDEEISFVEIKVKDEFITPIEEIQDEIKEQMHFSVYAYTLKIDGVEVGSLKTESEILDLLEEIKKPYQATEEDSENIKSIEFVEDVEIVKSKLPVYKVGTKEDLYNHLMTSSEEMKTHTVEVGESFWTIAKIYGMTVEELTAANADKDPSKLQIGDEIKLLVPKSLITVATKSEVQYTERIKYETAIEYNDKMYKTEKKTKVSGVSGEKSVVANEIKHNGIVVDKEIISEEVLKEPVTEVIIRGTQEPPKTVATGTFIVPTRGSISSRYGMRNGSMHQGIDYAAKTGTPINAADGGKIVFAGYKGNYGYLVEIDHGNGFKTRYAHCSKILVSVGDKVYKGQHIANVGNTGRSTGPHLHFEVLKNGKNYNPANYLK